MPPIYIPPSSGFTDLSGAPVSALAATPVLAGVNTGRVDVAVPVLASATWAAFYVTTSKVGAGAGDLGPNFIAIFDDSGFNPIGTNTINCGAAVGVSGSSHSIVWVNISANPQPLGYQVNNTNGSSTITLTINVYGYL